MSYAARRSRGQHGRGPAFCALRRGWLALDGSGCTPPAASALARPYKQGRPRFIGGTARATWSASCAPTWPAAFTRRASARSVLQLSQRNPGRFLVQAARRLPFVHLNVHYHVAVPDGVFSREPRRAERVVFHQLAIPNASDLDAIGLAVELRVLRWLRRLLPAERCATAASRPTLLWNRSAATKRSASIPEQRIISPYVQRGVGGARGIAFTLPSLRPANRRR